MKYVILIISLMISRVSIGQTIDDFTLAKTVSLAENKLIILDFWAIWCKPCLRMDRELWQSEEFEKLSNKFVLLKVDVTSNRSLAMSYGVTKIPRVLILTANEDILLDEEGYKGSNYLLEKFNSFPDDYSKLNERILPFLKEKVTIPENMYDLGEEFMKLGIKIENKSIRNMFMSISKRYFRKSKGGTDLAELKMMAELSQLRIDAYQEKYKKVKKRVNKIEKSEESEKITDMINFILAYCHKKEGNKKEMRKAIEKIKNKELIKELGYSAVK